jgi:hypothetical protein
MLVEAAPVLATGVILFGLSVVILQPYYFYAKQIQDIQHQVDGEDLKNLYTKINLVKCLVV